jgi:hypothetical protein
MAIIRPIHTLWFVAGVPITLRSATSLDVFSGPGEITYGYYDAQAGEIVLTQQAAANRLARALIHESLHAIDEAFALDLSHTTIRVLSTALAGTLYSNSVQTMNFSELAWRLEAFLGHVNGAYNLGLTMEALRSLGAALAQTFTDQRNIRLLDCLLSDQPTCP